MVANQHNILIVEDEPDGQVMMSALVEHLNLAVDVAGDAEEAEQYLFHSGKTYSAAIIDLALPDKDGWQILASIQNDNRTATLPCIAATAFHTSKLREDALQAGFTAYFSKPIDGTKFLQELEKLLS